MRPQISFLSPEEKEQIHQSALWLLENVGMQMPLQEAEDIMRKAGAKIADDHVIKIPRDLVADAVDKAPKREELVLHGREERHDIRFARDAPVFATMGGATHAVDLETSERRPCKNSDLANMVRLVDALENISVNGALATPQDVPKDISDWYAFATVLKNTTKPINTAVFGAQGIRDVVKMCCIAAGGEAAFRNRPFVSFIILTRCPFQIHRLSLEALMEVSREGLPMVVNSGPILGLTCPVTLAGALAQVHAEVLSGLVLAQLVHPGTPVIYGCSARSMDMKTSNASMASPEWSILKGAAGQMGRYLGLPVKMNAFLRDAKILDAQAGFESSTTGLVSALAADMVPSLQYDMDTLVDLADLVFGNEAMGALKQICRGFPVDETSLALDVIQKTGHGGSFLDSKHTLQNFRRVLWVPNLMERRSWDQWEKDGRKDMRDRARERAREILGAYRPKRLDAEAEAQIDQIVREARVHYAGSL